MVGPGTIVSPILARNQEAREDEHFSARVGPAPEDFIIRLHGDNYFEHLHRTQAAALMEPSNVV